MVPCPDSIFTGPASLLSRRQAVAEEQLRASRSTRSRGLQAALRWPPRNCRGRARSVIMIFNCGAPSHTDLWDPQAEGVRRGPGRVPADRHERPRVADLRTPPPDGQAGGQAGDRPVAAPRPGQSAQLRDVLATVGRPIRRTAPSSPPAGRTSPSFGTLVGGWLASGTQPRGGDPPSRHHPPAALRQSRLPGSGRVRRLPRLAVRPVPAQRRSGRPQRFQGPQHGPPEDDPGLASPSDRSSRGT